MSHQTTQSGIDMHTERVHFQHASEKPIPLAEHGTIWLAKNKNGEIQEVFFETDMAKAVKKATRKPL